MSIRKASLIRMKRFFLRVLVCLLIGCGSSAVKPTTDPIETLEQITSFQIRSNPCGCILNQPSLDYEVNLHGAWKRIHIDSNESDAEALSALRSHFYKAPKSTIEVQGRFLKVFYQWLPGHHAPSIRIDKTVMKETSRYTREKKDDLASSGGQ